MNFDDLEKERDDKRRKRLAKEADQLKQGRAYHSQVTAAAVRDLPKLQALEEPFWGLVDRFSRFVGIEVGRGWKRKRTFWGQPRSAIKTNASGHPTHPSLVVHFESYYSSYTNYIDLELVDGVLHFRASLLHTFRGPSTTCVETWADLDLSDSSGPDPVKWMDELFAEYAKKLRASRDYRELSRKPD